MPFFWGPKNLFSVKTDDLFFWEQKGYISGRKSWVFW